MQKKVIDIYPPKKVTDFPLEEPYSSSGSASPGQKRPSFSIKGIWLVLPLLVVPFLALHFLFAEAKITLWPQITELHIQEQIIAQVGQQNLDLGQKLIPAKLFEQEKEATRSFPATGKDQREERAGGTIRVLNDNPSAQTLVANTRFISEEGKLFRSRERVSVPPAQGGQPGSMDVEVEAAEPGKNYNVGPSNFSLPGLAGSPLYTTVYGKSSAPMTGGAIGEVLVVTQEDIAKAKEQLLADLDVEAKAALLERLPPNLLVLESSMETELLEDKSLVQEGAALDEFSYAARLKVSTLAFAKEDGVLLSRHLFESYLDNDQKIKEGTFKTNYSVEALNTSSGRMLLQVDISAEQYTDVDMTSLRNRFRGASQQEVADILVEFPTVAKAELSLWPFWLQRLPEDPNRVSLDLFL